MVPIVKKEKGARFAKAIVFFASLQVGHCRPETQKARAPAARPQPAHGSFDRSMQTGDKLHKKHEIGQGRNGPPDLI